MKLLDLFSEDSPFKIKPDDLGAFKQEQLEQIKDILPAFDEFRECGKGFSFSDSPILVNRDMFGNEVCHNMEIRKVGDGFQIPRGSVIYSITRSLEMFKKEDLQFRFGISPTIFEPGNFTPFKYITLKYSAEAQQDMQALNNMTNEQADKELRKLLHNQLDTILDNPDQYAPKPVYYLFIRMYSPKQDGQA